MSQQGAAGMWPEDRAVCEWANIHCPNIKYSDLHPLSRSVTAYRVEVQNERDKLRAERDELLNALEEAEWAISTGLKDTDAVLGIIRSAIAKAKGEK